MEDETKEVKNLIPHIVREIPDILLPGISVKRLARNPEFLLTGDWLWKAIHQEQLPADVALEWCSKLQLLLPGKEEYTPAPWHPSPPGLPPDHRAKTKLGKQGKRENTIAPERRVHHRGLRPPRRKKEGFHDGVVTFSFPVLGSSNTPEHYM